MQETLAAIAAEPQPRRLEALREDLELFLPARRASLVSLARSRAAGDAHAAFEAALDVALRAVVLVARAYVTRGL